MAEEVNPYTYQRPDSLPTVFYILDLVQQAVNCYQVTRNNTFPISVFIEECFVLVNVVMVACTCKYRLLLRPLEILLQ